MVNIKYDDIKNKILKDDFDGNTLIVEGTTGSGKTSLAMEKYMNLVDRKKVGSEHIRVFVLNSHQKVDWTDKMHFDLWGEFKMDTYSNFVRKELIKYWPLVEKKCSEVKKGMIRPTFISQDNALYMMEMLIDYFRRKKGYFSDITEESKKIAEEFISNMSMTALSMKDFKDIGNTIYSSIRLKENKNKDNYDHMDEIIAHYIKSMLSSGSMDMPIATYLYNRYLLESELYIRQLQKIKYLIVDDADEISKAQLNLIDVIRSAADKCYIFFNPQGGFCNYYGCDKEYVKSSTLFESERVKLEERCSSSKDIHMDVSSILRSEMIVKVADRILEAVNSGMDMDDICVISPVNDEILNCELNERLKDCNVNIKNLSRKNRLADNIYVHCIIIVLCKCIGDNTYDFTMDDYRKFFSFILGIDIVKSSVLAKGILNFGEFTDLTDNMKRIVGEEASEKYNHMTAFIKNCRREFLDRKMSVSQVIRLIFLDLLIDAENSKENINICRNLSEFSEKFIVNLKKFNTIQNPYGKLIDFVRREAGDFYSISDIEKMHVEDRGVIMASPYSFLTCSMKCSLQIWTDVQSSMWCPRNIKEFSNSYVFKNSWKYGDIYTEEMEENNRLKLLKSLVCALLKKCGGSVYLYRSEYSVNGYEQRGPLYQLMVDN